MSGLFGSLFDFNGDGELSGGEKAFGFAAMMGALSALEDAEVSVSCSFDDEDLDDMDRDELEAKLEELSEELDADYILNTNTKKFHYPTCSSVNDMKEKNKQEFFGTRDEAIANGYSPCGRCKP